MRMLVVRHLILHLILAIKGTGWSKDLHVVTLPVHIFWHPEVEIVSSIWCEVLRSAAGNCKQAGSFSERLPALAERAKGSL